MLETPGVKFDFDTSVGSDIKALIQKKFSPLNIIRVALAGGEVIADAWRALERPHNVTGEYQSTIQVHISDASERDAEVVVGTTAKQARFLEYGTSRETAQPVMRPAYDTSVDSAKARMAQEMINIANE